MGGEYLYVSITLLLYFNCSQNNLLDCDEVCHDTYALIGTVSRLCRRIGVGRRSEAAARVYLLQVAQEAVPLNLLGRPWSCLSALYAAFKS